MIGLVCHFRLFHILIFNDNFKTAFGGVNAERSSLRPCSKLVKTFSLSSHDLLIKKAEKRLEMIQKFETGIK